MRASSSYQIGPETPRAYRVNEFCRLYGIGRTNAYRLMRDGTLPSVVIGGRRLIPNDAAEALLRGGEKITAEKRSAPQIAYRPETLIK